MKNLIARYVCKGCGEMLPMKKNKFGEESTTTTCFNCNPYNFQKKHNKFMAHMRLMMKRYPERIVIIAECGCDKKKVQHHHDYNKTFDVYLLCQSCHMKVHHIQDPVAVVG